MTPGQLKRIRELEKENKMLKEIYSGSTLGDSAKDDQDEVIEIWDIDRVVTILNRSHVIENTTNPYKQRHEDLLALVDLLVLDSANPRAFAGVLRRLRTEIGKLPGDEATQQALREMLPAEGTGLTLESLRGADDATIGEALRRLAVDLAERAGALSNRIGELYFTLAQDADRRI